MISSTVILIGVLAVLVTLFFKNHAPITGKTLILNQEGKNVVYDITPAAAPVASGSMLTVLSYILTKSRFGPAITRLILDMNNVERLRELASQITIPPMYFPMRRLDKQELDEYYRGYDKDLIPNALQNGITPKEVLLQSSHSLRTVEDYALKYREGKVLPSTIVKNILKTIKEWEKKDFRIFAMIKEEEVLKQAYEADERFKQGKPKSIFDGVPVAFKDSVDVEGHIIYNGQNPKEEFAMFTKLAERHDVLVQRFEDQGAIILGTTLMIEGGVTPVGYSAHFQGPFSAYSWNRYSGGSSSGSAVAVATGLVPVAIGFDGGGSVRLPATMSGVHGLACGFARVPFESDLDSTLIKPGPIAASSADVALAFGIMAANEPKHFYSRLYDGDINGPPKHQLTGFNNIHDLSDVRVGIFPQWFQDGDEHVVKRCQEAVNFLKSRGVTVVEIAIPHLGVAHLAHGIKISTEFALGFDKAYHAEPSPLEPNTRITNALGSTATALEVLAGEKLRNFHFQYFTEKIFKQNNLSAIITPTISVDVPVLSNEAKVLGESDTAMSLLMTKHIFPANFLGLPGYSVPLGFLPPKSFYPGEDPKTVRLPIGLQLLGDHWGEHKLIRLAHAIEEGFSSQLKDEVNKLFEFRPF